jgi:hypothetical protein
MDPLFIQIPGRILILIIVYAAVNLGQVGTLDEAWNLKISI